MFLCLNNFVLGDTDTQRDLGRREFEFNKVAMPVLATGNQKVPVDLMLPELLNAGIFWLARGLPVQELKIVVYRQSDQPQAAQIFSALKQAYSGGLGTAPTSFSAGTTV